MVEISVSLLTATRDRAAILAEMALPSVLAQEDTDFEWIVVNDGGDPATSALLDSLPEGRVRRIDMVHPKTGFAPCIARNLALSEARGAVVAYLDDDNALEPGFIAGIKRAFAEAPGMQACIPLQRRRRDVLRADGGRKEGKPFLSPLPGQGVWDFVTQAALFDSNGFAHRLPFGPRWNPDWRIYSDYEFLLQCLNALAARQIGVSEAVDVLYVQTSQGIIGQSSYGEWAEELGRLCAQAGRYRALDGERLAAVQALAARYRAQAEAARAVPAFAQEVSEGPPARSWRDEELEAVENEDLARMIWRVNSLADDPEALAELRKKRF